MSEHKTWRNVSREPRCSFCEKQRGAVQNIVGGPGMGPDQVFICNECVALCVEIMDEENKDIPPRYHQ